MFKKEPTFFARDSDHNLIKDILASGKSFNVKFTISDPDVFNQFHFHRAGKIFIQGSVVNIHGKQYRSLLPNIPKEYSVAYQDIYNAHAKGNKVFFHIHPNQSAKAIQVGFLVKNATLANEIITLLPTQQTRAFHEEQIEHHHFEMRLNSVTTYPFVHLSLICINIIVYLLMMQNGRDLFLINPDTTISWGSSVGLLVLEGEWTRLFTAMFIHFDLHHIFANMLVLFYAGRMAERAYGNLSFLWIYIFSGVCGSLLSLAWNPLVNSAGASGAVFGVLGALSVFMLNPKNLIPKDTIFLYGSCTVGFTAYCLYSGWSNIKIDQAAHIGGLLTGIIMGIILTNTIHFKKRVKPFINRILLCSIVSFLIAGTLIYFAFHPNKNVLEEKSFIQAIKKFEVDEKKAVNDINLLYKKIQRKEINDTQVINELENKITPQWEDLYYTLVTPQLQTQSKRYAMQQSLVKYVDTRLKAYSLLTDGIRTNNTKAIKQAIETQHEADKQLRELNAKNKS